MEEQTICDYVGFCGYKTNHLNVGEESRLCKGGEYDKCPAYIKGEDFVKGFSEKMQSREGIEMKRVLLASDIMPPGDFGSELLG